MRMAKHNKKRNVGLTYELLVRVISKSVVENNNDVARRALKILKRHYKPGTEIYREFRLFKALVNEKMSEVAAAAVLTEARKASANYDITLLEQEKTALIKSISHLNFPYFWDQQFENYKLYATIQSLINDWRNPAAADFGRVVQYENMLREHLTRSSDDEKTVTIPAESPGTLRMLIKVMTNKINERYDGELTDAQRSLVRTYALSCVNGNKEDVKKLFAETRDRLVNAIDNYVSHNPRDIMTNERLDIVKNETFARGKTINEIEDSAVIEHLLYEKLINEIESKLYHERI